MGYTTDFRGQFDCTPALKPEHKAYLLKFAETRRIRRDPGIAEGLLDPAREAAGLPIGVSGEYFVGGTGDFGQDRDASILDYNNPPAGQPGLWCQWVPNADGTAIEWDGNEKFYHYEAWLRYIITNFLKPWGYTLNGVTRWRGEDFDDFGTITVENNEVTVHGDF